MALRAPRTEREPELRLDIKHYEDLLAMPEDGHRYELINGEIVMSPSPNMKHQFVMFELSQQLGAFVRKRNLGVVLFSPFDVKLSDLNAVQPDFLFVTSERLHIVGAQHLLGAPDLAIEVLSPSNRKIDLVVKAALYAEHGVREYWVVDPEAEKISVNVLRDGRYLTLAPKGRSIRSEVLAGISLDPKRLFALPPGVANTPGDSDSNA